MSLCYLPEHDECAIFAITAAEKKLRTLAPTLDAQRGALLEATAGELGLSVPRAFRGALNHGLAPATQYVGDFRPTGVALET